MSFHERADREVVVRRHLPASLAGCRESRLARFALDLDQVIAAHERAWESASDPRDHVGADERDKMGAALRAARALAGLVHETAEAERERARAHDVPARTEPAAGAGAGLAIGPEAAWFRMGDAPAVDLGRRDLLRRILAALVQQRVETPRRPLAIEALQKAAWPEYLIMNTVSSQITAFGEDDEGRSRGPGLHAWLTARGEDIGPDDYPPRAAHGRYLVDAFRAVCRDAPRGVRIHVHPHRAVDVASHGGRHLVVLDGAEGVVVDIVLLTTGHATHADARHEELASQARRAGARFLPSVYPVQDRIAPLGAGTSLGIIGLGLSSIDAIIGATVGRGGRFERDPSGVLSYLPSGREPRIAAWSRSGLPLAARAVNQKGPTGRHVAKVFTRAHIDELRARALARTGKPQLAFEEDLLPLLQAEMELANYRALSGDAFAERYLAAVGDADARRDDDQAVARSPFVAWRAAALADPAAPAAHDRARFVDAAGKVNHVLIGYWTDPERFTAFREASWNLSFWGSPRRLAEPTGYFRAELRVAVDRQESIYFADFPAGMARCPEASLAPTFESGYWGAMRDRIPAAAADPLVSSFSGPLSPRDRPTEGARFRVLPPQNLAIIRSGQSWRRCGEQQLREYRTRMRPRLEKGLSYLAGSPEESGCCSLRYLHHGDAGEDQGETSVQGIFRSLADLERWAEGHRTHKAIHAEAFRQLRVYNERRELRTWHEVLVLAAREQRFEYLSCHPRTGLLPYFEAVRTDG